MRIPSYAFALVAAAALVVPQIASAHAKLVTSTPAANSTVAKPTKIELRFNEALMGATASAQVVMTGMPGMADHAPMKISGFTSRMGKDGKSMTLLLKRPLATGTYTVTWSAAGKDTHRMGSSFSFTVK